MGNLDIWEKVAKVPSNYLKAIAAGRMKGKSDINPQWRYKALTENFGICGVGWKYEVIRLWLEPGSNDQMCAFAEIKLYVLVQGAWSDAIPGIGGSMLINKESAGLYTSDEAYKMAITDALSVACKMLGIGSAVYEGLWDGSKYKDAPAIKEEQKKPSTPAEVVHGDVRKGHAGEVEKKLPANWDKLTQGQQQIHNKRNNTNWEVKK